MKGKKGLTCIFTAFCACLVGTVLFTACDFKELTHTHAYAVNIQEATCTQKGLKTYTCSCGESYTEEIASLGHDFAEYISDNNATYKKDGTKTATCRREGCDTTDTVIDKGSKKEPTGNITFTTLTYEDEFLLAVIKEKGITTEKAVVILTKKLLIYQTTLAIYSVITTVIYYNRLKNLFPGLILFVAFRRVCFAAYFLVF